MSDTSSSSTSGAEKPSAPSTAAAPKPKPPTLPERIGQAMDDRRNEENHRPAPRK